MDERAARLRLLHDVLEADVAPLSDAVRARCYARLAEPRRGLLEDVLAEDAPAPRVLRTRLRRRLAGPGVRSWLVRAAAVVLVGALVALSIDGPPSNEPPTRDDEAESAEPAPRWRIASRPLAREQRVTTPRAVMAVRTHGRGAIRTTRRSGFRVTATHRMPRVGPALRSRVPVISEAQLLAALDGRPVAIVRRGQGAAELLLLDPDDEAALVHGARTNR